MAGSIICGTDDSESAKRAARVARDLGSKLGFRLVFVHVLEPGSPHERISAVAERLHELTDGCTDVDCGASWVVDVGHPVDRLIAAAVDEDASLIVVGSQGTRSSLLGHLSLWRFTAVVRHLYDTAPRGAASGPGPARN